MKGGGAARLVVQREVRRHVHVLVVGRAVARRLPDEVEARVQPRHPLPHHVARVVEPLPVAVQQRNAGAALAARKVEGGVQGPDASPARDPQPHLVAERVERGARVCGGQEVVGRVDAVEGGGHFLGGRSVGRAGGGGGECFDPGQQLLDADVCPGGERVQQPALEHDARGELLLLVPKLGRLCNYLLDAPPLRAEPERNDPPRPLGAELPPRRKVLRRECRVPPLQREQLLPRRRAELCQQRLDPRCPRRTDPPVVGLPRNLGPPLEQRGERLCVCHGLRLCGRCGAERDGDAVGE
mmetsp:Transcript_46197/g.150074  ORF Transcript_46197/g.150074 Transcript_46197/m.150074 type:complete len:297 (+) Transcript_46197:568-1458(+)